jgi:hypothetical protein
VAEVAVVPEKLLGLRELRIIEKSSCIPGS